MPAFSMGKSKRAEEKLNSNPGPGSYVEKDKVDAPAWTMSSVKQPEKVISNSPGPGAYNSDYSISKDKAPSYAINGRQKNAAVSQLPGPGQYNPSKNFVTQKNTFDISFASKLSNGRSDHLTAPGPGNYEIKREITGPIGAKFGSEARNKVKTSSDNPGPGSYKIQSTVGGSVFKFGTSQRGGAQIKSSAPGPGQYEPKRVIGNDGQKSTLLGRPKSVQKLHLTPGPGAYNADKKSNVPSYKLGRELRTTGKNVINAPGPGQYKLDNYDFDSRERKAPTWKMGTEKRDNTKLNTSLPGPGSYSLQTSLGLGPKIQMGSKLTKASEKLNVTGPGTYCPEAEKVHKSIQKVGIGYGKRSEQALKKDVPGPGAYQAKTSIENGPKFGFGKEQRGKNEKKNNSPGPGAYKLPSKIGELPNYDNAATKSQEFKYT